MAVYIAMGRRVFEGVDEEDISFTGYGFVLDLLLRL